MDNRIQTDEALNHSIKLYYSLSNDGIFDWDFINESIYFDKKYFTMAGYQPNEFSGTFDEWKERVHPNDYLYTSVSVDRYLTGKAEKYDEEFRFLRKDGTWMWIRARIKFVTRDENGDITRIIGTHTDITEKKELEIKFKQLRDDKLVKSEQLIRDQSLVFEEKVQERTVALDNKIDVLERYINSLEVERLSFEEIIKTEKDLLHKQIKNVIMPSLNHLRNSKANSETIDNVYDCLNKITSLKNQKQDEEHKNLSERESQILMMVELNKTSKEIAADLDLSPSTVERHRHNIRKKMGRAKKINTAKK